MRAPERTPERTPEQEPRIPYRLLRRPRQGGLPIPYLAMVTGGVADFRCADGRTVLRCMRERRCGLCGQTLERTMVFIGGPGIKEGRITSEPPAHEECARYALRACPYLAGKKARRTTDEERARRGAPPMEGLYDHASAGGAIYVLYTESYRIWQRPETGLLYYVCAPWVRVLEVTDGADGADGAVVCRAR